MTRDYTLPTSKRVINWGYIKWLGNSNHGQWIPQLCPVVVNSPVSAVPSTQKSYCVSLSSGCSVICYESAYKMPAPPNCVFTVFAFVGFFFCLIRFPMQFHGGSQGVHVHIAFQTTIIQLGMSVLTSIWRGLDSDVFSWALTQLFGTTIRKIGLQSGVI